jgi:RNA polymerase sigma-70 factor, ECF subfamily
MSAQGGPVPTGAVHRADSSHRADWSHRSAERALSGASSVEGDAGATTNDRTLVDAVLAGDRDAFRHLVEREGPAVVSACARVLGDRAEAEDVAQEAFVIAYRSLGSWRADGAFGAWLSRIAVRLAIRRASQRRQVTWLDPLAAEADLPGQDRYRTSITSGSADPAHTILRTERDAHIRAAVAALDEPYREVVALRFFAERSLAEIADATDRPLGTVKTHLHRGLARLRRSLEEADR